MLDGINDETKKTTHKFYFIFEKLSINQIRQHARFWGRGRCHDKQSTTWQSSREVSVEGDGPKSTQLLGGRANTGTQRSQPLPLRSLMSSSAHYIWNENATLLFCSRESHEGGPECSPEESRHLVSKFQKGFLDKMAFELGFKEQTELRMWERATAQCNGRNR